MIQAVWAGPEGLTPYGYKKKGDLLPLSDSQFKKLKSEKLVERQAEPETSKKRSK